jgi:hypothetical protein
MYNERNIYNIKFVNTQQAKIIYRYKNTKEKLLETMQLFGSIKYVEVINNHTCTQYIYIYIYIKLSLYRSR